jgi:hypothetical protein
MTNFRSIAAAAALLLVASPAMAKESGRHAHFDRRRNTISTGLPRAFDYGSAYGAYDFYSGHNFVPETFDGDFDRRNTFN